jgi:ABC-type nitrate/sulfonate/bicarbonate transport system permease component
MSGTGVESAAAASTVWRVTALQVAIIATIMVAWEALAPRLAVSRRSAPACHHRQGSGPPAGERRLRQSRRHGGRIGATLIIGGLSGLATGIFLGANRFASHTYESLIYYLEPPKIISFP